MAKIATISPEANRNQQAGYTLAELLIVLVIIAITTAVIAPRLFTNTDAKNAKIGSTQLAALYKKGRNLAINTGVSQLVIIDTNTKTAWLNDLKKIKFADGIDIDTKTAEPESDIGMAGIRFFPDGVSTGGEIKISSDTNSYLVSVIWANAEVRLEIVQ